MRASLPNSDGAPSKSLACLGRCFFSAVAMIAMAMAARGANAAKVFEYRLDEGQGTLAVDSSGNQIDAVLTSTSDFTAPNWSSGYSGSGLQFDGVGDLLWLDDQPALDIEQFTLMSWVNYAPSPDPDEKRIEVMEKAGSYWMNIRMDTRKMRLGGFFGAGPSPDWVFLDTASPIPQGTWTHLAGTYDGNTLTTYINGLSSSTKSVSGPVSNNDQPLIIGAKFRVTDDPASDESTALFNGNLDEVRVFDSALSASQILQYASMPVLAGDFDDDFDVDGADFLKWQRGESTFELGQSDLDDWLAGFETAPGSVAAASTSVPEPPIGLSLLSLLLLCSGYRASEDSMLSASFQALRDR